MEKTLSQRIYAFLDRYAVVSPNFETEADDKYTSPDVYQLLSCAELIESGIQPLQCHSSWESGGYKPYVSKEGRAEHDMLVKEVYKIIHKRS